MDMTSGSSSAKNCTKLLVDNNNIIIMGGDVMDQLGLRLTMRKSDNKGEKSFYNILNIHQKILKWIFTQCPHLFTRLGRSKNHVSKPTFKKEFQPTHDKGRRIPLELTEKVEKGLKKIIDEKQIKKQRNAQTNTS